MDAAAQSASSSAVDAAAINRAALLLAPVVRSTPLERCERLSVATGSPVLLKREDTQVVRSYKVRGAYNLIASLPEDARAKGVVCASAGNHAQSVAFSCAALGIPGRVFLPATTPRQKRQRRRRGRDLGTRQHLQRDQHDRDRGSSEHRRDVCAPVRRPVHHRRAERS